MNRMHLEPRLAPASEVEKRMIVEIARVAYQDPTLRWKDLDAHVWHREMLKVLRAHHMGGRMD